MTDRLKRLSSLLQTYNPFGVTEKGVYISYHSTKDAYVDVMMRVTTLCPRGYIDIPMVFAIIMGLPMVTAINLCKRRDFEIMYIDMKGELSENIDKWRALLQVLLRNTNVAFDEKIFYAAWPEFMHMCMKQDSLSEVLKQKQEQYYDEQNDNESSEDAEGYQE